jgi:hypothetical protein
MTKKAKKKIDEPEVAAATPDEPGVPEPEVDDYDDAYDDNELALITIEGLRRVLDIADAKIEAQAGESYYVDATPSFGETQTFVCKGVAELQDKLIELRNSGTRVKVRVILGRQLKFTPDARAIITPGGPLLICDPAEGRQAEIAVATFGGKDEPPDEDPKEAAGREADDIAEPDDDPDDADDIGDDEDEDDGNG